MRDDDPPPPEIQQFGLLCIFIGVIIGYALGMLQAIGAYGITPPP